MFSTTTLYRGVAAALWALALYNSLACRGLFWDGAAFLANIVDTRTFHDFYPARAHVGWVTQAPVLIALHLGVTDLRLLAILQSAGLFALPVGLYHLAMARVRHDPALLAVVLAAIAAVFLPTSFFIVGEYNAAYAAVTAAMAVLLTGRGGRGDKAILLLLGALCLRSYEAMVYLGPLVAAAVLWATWRRPGADRDPATRLLGTLAALGFLGGAVVSGATMAIYWHHPHFVAVRAAAADFWQNLQFTVVLAGVVLFALGTLVRPSWLKSRAPAILILAVAALLVALPWIRFWRPEAYIFPPSHYVARSAAGGLLFAMLAGMWIYAAVPANALRLLAYLHDRAAATRLATATAALVLANFIPDLSLTHLWNNYLGYLRGVVTSHTGFVSAATLPMHAWPQRLFDQEWTVPALTALLRRGPDDAIVTADPASTADKVFDREQGTLPKLVGYGWR